MPLEHQAGQAFVVDGGPNGRSCPPLYLSFSLPPRPNCHAALPHGQERRAVPFSTPLPVSRSTSCLLYGQSLSSEKNTKLGAVRRKARVEKDGLPSLGRIPGGR